MAEKKVAGVILPTTAYILKLVPPPVRKMIENNVIVALASDYNPNGESSSFLLIPAQSFLLSFKRHVFQCHW